VFSEVGSYEQEIDAWRQQRIESLRGPSGYLNLAGLFWLRKARSTFGAGPNVDMVFPTTATPVIGEFELREDRVVMHVAEGIVVEHDGQAVSTLSMQDDRSATPVTATMGSLAWTVINRDQRFAVRLRDFENPALQNFPEISYYATDADYRVIGVMRRYDTPRQVRVDTVIEGLDYKPMSPGVVRFALSGESLELESYQLNDGLLIVFGDTTTGRETYPAGRFLYTAQPDHDGKVVLDFNKAENPPCAFNDFATCPIASPRNRLAVRIEAGERYDPRMH
jgi:uncharacterized protein (DUF1684 family)